MNYFGAPWIGNVAHVDPEKEQPITVRKKLKMYGFF